MNAEEKQAVQDSKNIINELNNHKDKDFIGRMYYKNKPIEETLEILLNLIEKLQTENEELKIVKSAIQTLQINSIEDENYIVISKNSFLDGSYKHLIDDYIPKQKLKDKMKELEWSLGGYDSKIASARHSQAIGAYMVLMDLLNGKGE